MRKYKKDELKERVQKLKSALIGETARDYNSKIKEVVVVLDNPALAEEEYRLRKQNIGFKYEESDRFTLMVEIENEEKLIPISNVVNENNFSHLIHLIP